MENRKVIVEANIEDLNLTGALISWTNLDFPKLLGAKAHIVHERNLTVHTQKKLPQNLECANGNKWNSRFVVPSAI